jgi:catechol 2,3-dioxygenase-like lactoylglutathione lyase family enzyme
MANTRPEFNHVIVYVKDVPRSLGFYRDRLRFPVIEEVEGYARLRSPRGSSTLALHALGKGQTLDPKKETIRLYFEVEGLDALCRRLVKEGVKIDQPPKDMEWGWRHAYLRDPDGHEISLYWAGEKRFQKSPM